MQELLSKGTKRPFEAFTWQLTEGKENATPIFRHFVQHGSWAGNVDVRRIFDLTLVDQAAKVLTHSLPYGVEGEIFINRAPSAPLLRPTSLPF